MNFRRLFPLILLFAGCSSIQINCCKSGLPYDEPSACSDPNAAFGAHNGECHGGSDCQLSTDTCFMGNCVSCGGSGRPCCDNDTAAACHSGLQCVKGPEAYKTCEGCGYLNGDCCPGGGDPCPADDGATCKNGTCVHDSNEGSGAGHFVWLLTPGKCAVLPWYFSATSVSNATSQAQAHLAEMNVGQAANQQYSLAPLDTDPNDYPLCMYPGMNSIDPMILHAFNLIQLGSCELETAGGKQSTNWGWQGEGASCPAWPNTNPQPTP